MIALNFYEALDGLSLHSRLLDEHCLPPCHLARWIGPPQSAFSVWSHVLPLVWSCSMRDCMVLAMR